MSHQEFEVFGSVLHPLYDGFEKAVHEHVHVNVYVNVDVHVLVDVVWRIKLRSGPFEGPASIKPALPEDTHWSRSTLRSSLMQT